MKFKFFFRFATFRSRFYREIQAVEDDSAWQLHNLLKRIPDPQIRAQTFLHILEEEGHAEIFKKSFQKENHGYFNPKPVSRMTMADEKDPLWKYFASLTAGERSAARFFGKLNHASSFDQLNKDVVTVLKEELSHVEAGVKAPQFLGVASDLYLSQVAYLESKRNNEIWLSRLQWIVNGIVSLLIIFIYFLFVPFFFLASYQRIKKPSSVFYNNCRKVY